MACKHCSYGFVPCDNIECGLCLMDQEDRCERAKTCTHCCLGICAKCGGALGQRSYGDTDLMLYCWPCACKIGLTEAPTCWDRLRADAQIE